MNIFNKYTLKTLGKNKTRTLVTIIGIILSAAMITAVTTFISSLQTFLVEKAIDNNGNWHGLVYGMEEEELAKVKANDQVSRFCVGQNIGYSYLEEGKNEEKPYLHILGIDENFKKMMPIHLLEGRLPEKEGEILLPKHLEINGGIKYQLGEELKLTLGDREYEGMELYQDTEWKKEEQFLPKEDRTYTVVGVYERPSFELYRSPGYTALTLQDYEHQSNENQYKANVYITMKDAKDIYPFIEDNFSQHYFDYNYDYLRFSGDSNEYTFNAVLFGLAYVLITIIVVASISLIYNAFSISVGERTKQFGLLSSIGATKRQLMKSVMFEAIFLSVIGIPLGILSGMVGIGVTLRLTENLFLTYIDGSYNGNVVLKLSVSMPSIVIAALIGFITVIISAFLPARRAVKIPAIDAIRQAKDINIRPSSVKTSKLTYKLFGFSGMIASKNFKRNRRKYRATVASLSVSIILFISASSFIAYIEKSVTTIVTPSSYDITYYYSIQEEEKRSMEEIYRLLSTAEGVTQKMYFLPDYCTIRVKTEDVSKEYVEFNESNNGLEALGKEESFIETYANICFVNDEEYSNYLKENGLDEKTYMDVKSPKGIAKNFIKYQDSYGRYHTFGLLNKEKADVQMVQLKKIDGYYFSESKMDENGNTMYYYEKINEVEDNSDENSQLKQEKDDRIIELPEKEVVRYQSLNIGTTMEVLPFGLNSMNGSNMLIVYPYSAIPSILGDDISSGGQLLFKVKDHKKSFDAMYQLLLQNSLDSTGLYDMAQDGDTDRAMITIVHVFAYGFITLISLISVANVFNTISTNMNLRRREFAMLTSIGLSRKGFHRMMNYECLLYGMKALLYGIPISIGVTYFIYQSILNGWETSFFIPAYSIVIAVGSVFFVVFSTMLYTTRKIKKENTIDALKNENL